VDQSTTVLFGLPEVRVRRVDQVESGARVVHVETAEGGSAASCPGCGVVSVSVKENVVTRPVDLSYGERPLAVAWHKTRWRCREPLCARLTFTEVIEEVPAGRRTTGRLRRAIACAVGDACRSVATLDLRRPEHPVGAHGCVGHRVR
jgi:transposase